MDEGLDGRDTPFFKEDNKPVLEIEKEAIYEGYSEEDMGIFVREFYLIFSILEKLDQDYGELDNSQTKKNIKKFKEMIKDWNLKYKDILLDFVLDGIQCRLNVFFDESLSDIIILIKKMNRFIKVSSQSGARINAIFREGNSEDENSLTLSSASGRAQLIYSKEDMQKPQSPEFRLCAYYALKNGFNHDINLESAYSDVFSFSMSEILKYDWFSRWNVRFGR